MIKILLTLISITLAFAASAQEFAIKKMELDGDRINIYYDLIDTTANRTYTINLYSTLDNYTSPLLKVSGDQGLEVKPGINRKIVWNAKEETGDYEGKIGFEIKGKAYVPFIKLKGFKDQQVHKRGVKFDMLWTGGRVNSLLNFELYRNGKFVAAPKTNVAASLGKTEMVIPVSVKAGSNYQFKITDSKNKDDIIFTETFRVRQKYPFVIKAGVLAAIGAGIYFITSSGSTPEVVPDIIDPSIPSKK